ncbi:MAG: alpha/beta hydrolase [Alphaproteobacteria bacterium]|nr:alpha/beta hydrolase [Alphaproteobacteria bacterium]
MPFATIGENELSYSFNGAKARRDGVSVVLVHGAGGKKQDWHATWRSASNKMQGMGLTARSEGRQLEKYPIYAIDLPGHGRSTGQSHTHVEAYADAIASFLEAMDLQRVVLVGHSMGAAIALTLAVTSNPRLAGIALIGGSGRLIVSDAILDGLQTSFEPTVDAIVKYSWHRDTSAFFKKEGRQHLLEAGSGVVYNDFLACSRFDLSDRLSEITIPVLVMAAEQDRMVPLEDSRTMASAFKFGTFAELQDCGHYMHVEKPREAAGVLVSFLENGLVE